MQSIYSQFCLRLHSFFEEFESFALSSRDTCVTVMLDEWVVRSHVSFVLLHNCFREQGWDGIHDSLLSTLSPVLLEIQKEVISVGDEYESRMPFVVPFIGLNFKDPKVMWFQHVEKLSVLDQEC